MYRIELPQLTFPAEVKTVFDPIRKRFVVTTPEERVRQSVIQYLIYEKKYPRSLVGVEVSLLVNNLKKRCDVVLYKNSRPVMLVECKAPSVKIDQAVFDQIGRYNLALSVPYLLVTNGKNAFCCKIDFNTGTFLFLPEVPEYGAL